jgi:hypothetical protein
LVLVLLSIFVFQSRARDAPKRGRRGVCENGRRRARETGCGATWKMSDRDDDDPHSIDPHDPH